MSWLREFVDVPVPAEELGRMLSMRGFELAAIEPPPALAARPGSAAPEGQDAVLDFEITANRPDCLSVLGIAREVSTAFMRPLRLPGSDAAGPLRLHRLTPAETSDVAVHLEDTALCPRYAAAVVDVTIGPSPAWLADRLRAADIRPINNVVDVTNYVLMELGQPMHAFDLARMEGARIHIRRARAGETIRTLDGEQRALDPQMLVIADGERAQAIAGVMGGATSEVGPATRTIALESACFEPRAVRRTSKRLSLKTEASARFERGADIGAPVLGIERACALLEEMGAGRARGGVIDRYPSPAAAKHVTLRLARIARLLGEEVDEGTVVRILTGLAFSVTPGGNGWEVTVPTFRVDVSREADLIEEIARHVGYDRLPTTFPALIAPPPPPDPRIERDRLVRRVLAAAGCSEAITFSFIETAAADPFQTAGDRVAIGNPLSAQFAVLRPSLLPGLVASVAHNRRREQRDIRLFEVGACFTRQGERRSAGIAWTGDAESGHWSGERREVDFFDLKGIVERVGEALDVSLHFQPAGVQPVSVGYLVAGRAAQLIARPAEASSSAVPGVHLGYVGQLAPAIAAAAGLPKDDEVYVAELDLDAIDRARSMIMRRATPLPRYPSIIRDISIIVDDALPAAAVRGTIRSVAPETLASVREFDRYQGKGVPDGRVSLSLRLTFRSPERTLTDAEILDAMDRVLEALAREHQAVQR